MSDMTLMMFYCTLDLYDDLCRPCRRCCCQVGWSSTDVSDTEVKDA